MQTAVITSSGACDLILEPPHTHILLMEKLTLNAFRAQERVAGDEGVLPSGDLTGKTCPRILLALPSL